jgi:SsrA-binding protein
MAAKSRKDKNKQGPVAVNKKAYRNFELIDKFEAGLELLGAAWQHEPTRKRKLLLHKAEIHRIRTKLEQRGFTLVPLRIYFNERGLAKIELALARGKRQYDKRKAITERDQKRDVDRSMKKYRR